MITSMPSRGCRVSEPAHVEAVERRCDVARGTPNTKAFPKPSACWRISLPRSECGMMLVRIASARKAALPSDSTSCCCTPEGLSSRSLPCCCCVPSSDRPAIMRGVVERDGLPSAICDRELAHSSPTERGCEGVGRRCRGPAALPPLFAAMPARRWGRR